MPNIRSILSATIGVGVALALVACGSSGPGAATSSSASMWALTGSDQKTVQNSTDVWNHAHADQAVKVDFFANDAYKTKVRTAIGAGEGPTFIYGWGGGSLKAYADAGSLEDLSGYLADNPELQARFLPSVLANGQIDGKTYALPNNRIQPAALYFNKDLFDQIGAQPPKTWDELMALVPRFNEAGIAPISLAGQSKWPDLMWLSILTDRIGGPAVFEKIAAGEGDSWSNPAIIEALTKIQDLVQAGGFIKGFSSVAADTSADKALLYTGKAAMLLALGSGYQDTKAGAPAFVAAGKLGYVPFPTVEGGTGDPRDVVGNPSNLWSVNAKATVAQKAAAESYLKDGMFTEASINDVIASGAVPPVKGIEDKLASSPDKDFLEFTYKLASEAPHFQLSWDQALSPKQADALLTNLDRIFVKGITPQQFVDAMNATL